MAEKPKFDYAVYKDGKMVAVIEPKKDAAKAKQQTSKILEAYAKKLNNK